MKKNLLFIVLITLPFIGFSQTEILQLDSMYFDYNGAIRSENIQSVHYYQYDEKRRITEVLSRSRLSISYTNKVVHEYFEAENEEVKTSWRFNNSTQNLQLDSQLVRYFDGLDRIITENIFGWDTNTNLFLLDKTNRYEYDAKGNLVLRILGKYEKTEWTYNAQNLLTNIRFSYWDYPLNDWKNPFFFEENIYNNFGQLLSNTATYSDIKNVTEYAYDDKNRLKTLKTYRIDTPLIDTLYTTIQTFFYQGNSNQIATSLFQTKISEPTWGLNQLLYTYDDFGNLETVVTQRKDDNGDWENAGRDSYLFNENNLLETQMKMEYWDISNDSWSNSAWFVDVFEYYDNNELKKHFFYNNDPFCGVGSYDVETIYFRSKKTIETVNNEDITCAFPNPYINFQNIHCDELVPEERYDLMIFSIIGQTVYETKFTGRNGFFIEKQLDKGWYVFVIVDDGKIVQKQKILVF
jgi:YD repeat-containing protein